MTDRPPYPEGDVVGPCVCGSWPGGKCLKCPWTPAPAPPEGEVKMPTTADEAALMLLLGHRWLLEHAPERLTDAGRAGAACQHAWCDARNQYVLSGEFCLRCGAVRGGNQLAAPTSPTPTPAQEGKP